MSRIYRSLAHYKLHHILNVHTELESDVTQIAITNSFLFQLFGTTKKCSMKFEGSDKTQISWGINHQNAITTEMMCVCLCHFIRIKMPCFSSVADCMRDVCELVKCMFYCDSDHQLGSLRYVIQFGSRICWHSLNAFNNEDGWVNRFVHNYKIKSWCH